MATINAAKCKLCRREGVKLFLKGIRCETAKCGVSKRNYPPGERHWRRGKPSEYGQQLREKQKVRRMYGVMERTFHNYYVKAAKTKANTGVALLMSLERRLDNVLYRSCIAASRRQARMLIGHKHVTVNGARVNRAGFQVSQGDEVALEGDKALAIARGNAAEVGKARNVPNWLAVDAEKAKVSVREQPQREDIPEAIQEQLIVELYGR
jgi:small subunit ribosomal protein S4